MKLINKKKYVVFTVCLIVIAIGAFLMINATRKKDLNTGLQTTQVETNTEVTTADVSNSEESSTDETGTDQVTDLTSDSVNNDTSLAVTAYNNASGSIESNAQSSANTNSSHSSSQNTGSQNSGSQNFGSSNSGSTKSGSSNSGSSNSGSQNQVVPPTSAPSVDTSLSLREQVLQLTNQIRNEVGATNLVLDEQLSAIADIRAKEIVTSFEHTRPDGSQFYSALQENGYTYRTCGENIAYGYSSASSVVTGWKNSSGHYKNMVNTGFGRLGVGVYVSNGTYYWVQLFSD